jgi:PIN domain nuclease of toxin-antitoxin system
MGSIVVIVLDTHALVWWVTGDAELSKKAKTVIEREQHSGEIIVSAISVWEITMLVEKGRLILSMDVSSWLATVAEIERVKFLPVDMEIANKSVVLPGEFHKDPADRMIVATSRKLAVPVVTQDEKIRSYPHVKTIW